MVDTHRPNPAKLILMNELIYVYGIKYVVGWCPVFHTKFRDKLVTTLYVVSYKFNQKL